MTRAASVATALLAVLLAVACRIPPRAVSHPATPRAAPGHVRVAGVVLKWIKGDPDANLARLEPLVREAADNGADLVCTTECFLDGYVTTEPGTLADLLDHAEPVPEGASFRRLAALARETGVHLVAGLQEREGDRTHNAAVVLSPDGELLGTYRKRRLGFEAVRSTPGDGPVLVDTPVGRIGLILCADRRDPDLVDPYGPLGADFVLCPSGGMFGRRNDRIVAARSREVGLPIVFVHPVEFLVTAPDGSIAARELVPGDDLAIEPHEVGGGVDGSGVFYVDLPVSAGPRGGRP